MNEILNILDQNIICLFIGHKQGERIGYPYTDWGTTFNYCKRCNHVYMKGEPKA